MNSIIPIDQQIITVTRTLNSGYLQTHKFLGITPYKPLKDTTLNEKFGIQNETELTPGQIPYNRYLVIGNQGHRFVKGEDGSDETEPVIHRATNNGLYNHIPFVLRPADDDLTANERQKYGLRRPEVHEGKNYIAYYARRFDVSLVKPALIEIEVINGVEIPKPYIPTSDDLNPVRPEISNNGTIIGSNKNISSTAIVTIELTDKEVAEIVNAHRIRTGSMRSPIISELGICSGVDKNVEATGPIGTFQYTEIIGCQISTHITSVHPIGYNSSGLTIRLDVGNTEPRLGDQAVHRATIIP